MQKINTYAGLILLICLMTFAIPPFIQDDTSHATPDLTTYFRDVVYYTCGVYSWVAHSVVTEWTEYTTTDDHPPDVTGYAPMPPDGRVRRVSWHTFHWIKYDAKYTREYIQLDPFHWQCVD